MRKKALCLSAAKMTSTSRPVSSSPKLAAMSAWLTTQRDCARR
jgi:hypothetical protein